MTIWAAILRTHEGDIAVMGVASMVEIFHHSKYLSLRQRFNTEERIIVLRYPTGTKAQQVVSAIEMLTRDERLKLWNLTKRGSRE